MACACVTWGPLRVCVAQAIAPVDFKTGAEYAASTSTTLNHFHEKLLKLKDMMKTNAGRRIAEARHEYMLGYLEQVRVPSVCARAAACVCRCARVCEQLA